MDPIVDSTKEMDPAGPEFKDMLATLQAPKAEKVVDKPKESEKDVKQDEPASSADGKTLVKPKVDKAEPLEEEEEETLEKLKGRVTGLKAELTRREGNAKRVQELEVELAATKARLEERKDTKAEESIQDKVTTAIRKLDDKQLSSKRTEWSDEAIDARFAYREADARGDSEARNEAQSRLIHARDILSQLDQEFLGRAKTASVKENERVQEETALGKEIGNLFDGVYDKLPEIKDKESDVWKAGNEQFLKHPKLMAQLGPLGELVATAYAIVQNPQLVAPKAKPADTRKQTLKEIESITHKSLLAGTSGSGKSVANYDGVVTGESSLSDFEALVDKMKQG